uniref:Uncharacterized protein n=1 Tax=Scophthalmus maximus TaxID=52904 RepID=A0A8D3ADM8_SCOMX
MAKWGEGDPRWIVEECVDATNVNNWHWSVFFFFFFIRSCTEVDSDSDSDSGLGPTGSRGQRWQQRGSWLGTSSGGVKYRGTVEVNDLSDENDLDEVQRVLGEYVHQLKSEFSQGRILPIANGLKPPEPTMKIQIQSSRTQCSSSSAPCPTGVGIPTCSFNLEENFQTSAAELYRTFINQEFVQVFTRSEAVVDGCLGGRFLLLDGSISGAFTQLVRRFRTWPSGEKGWTRFYFQAIKYQTFRFSLF